MAQDLRGPIEASLREAVAAASWLEASDGALVELGAMYARRLDHAWNEFASGALDGPELTKTLYIGPHLLGTLKSLGLSPEDRQKIMASKPAVKEVDLVDDLKRKRRARAVGGD